MAKVIFYEKRGCINNTKQKGMLINAGHQVESHDLREISWNQTKLSLFLQDLPVVNWFNRSSPRIKSGEIIPENLDKSTAIELMIADPLLIRRPLIEVENVYQVGFEQDKINAWIGLNTTQTIAEDLETCPHSHQKKLG